MKKRSKRKREREKVVQRGKRRKRKYVRKKKVLMSHIGALFSLSFSFSLGPRKNSLLSFTRARALAVGAKSKRAAYSSFFLSMYHSILNRRGINGP